MKAYHICYHTDEDGLAAAGVIYEYLKKYNKIINEYKIRYFFYEIDYTMDLKTVLPPNIPAGDELYFVDYSFSNVDNLKYILDLKDITVVWIDHHKTSLDIVESMRSDLYKRINFRYYINTNYCGAYLAYVYAFLKLKGYCDYELFTTFDAYVNSLSNEIPLYIKYVDSWDTWKHDMPNTTEFNIGARSEHRTPRSLFGNMFKFNGKIIDKLFSDNEKDMEIVFSYMKKYIDKIISKGKVIKAYQDIENESICNDYGFSFNIIDCTNGGRKLYNCFAVNKRGSSTMFGDRVNEYDVVIPFQFNGKQYKYSLFTTKDNVDCESLAKKFGSIDGLGGGGHAKAAGFQTYDQLIKDGHDIYITNKLLNKNQYKVKSIPWVPWN